MLWKRTIEEARAEIDGHVERLTEQLRGTSDAVTYALVIVGTVAVAALIIALAKQTR